jgi:DNA-binding NarL/FixJ family response regulator
VSPTDLGLTDRQLEVLALIVQGKNNKSICQTLNLAEPTVKNHVTAIFKALKVANRAEAVIAVNELGWRLPVTPTP